MTLPADSNSENDKTSDPDHKTSDQNQGAGKKPDGVEAGKSLATAGMGPINPFIAASVDPEPVVVARPFMSRMLDYSAHAAIIVGLIGFAWTVSDHVVSHPTAKADAPAPVAAAALPAPTDEMTQLRLSNQKMHDEIKALRTSLDTLRTAVRRDTTPEQVRMLSAGLDTMKAGLSSTNAAIGQINTKIDKLQPAKVQQLGERVGRLEHQALDSSPTASLSKSEPEKSAPKPPTKPTTLADAEDVPGGSQDDAKPQVISGWVVRDVYQGVALVEGKRGPMEVVPGMAIPGAGVVKSIERHGSGWTVTTTKGQIASNVTPQRDYHRNSYSSSYYSRYRYGY